MSLCPAGVMTILSSSLIYAKPKVLKGFTLSRAENEDSFFEMDPSKVGTVVNNFVNAI